MHRNYTHTENPTVNHHQSTYPIILSVFVHFGIIVFGNAPARQKRPIVCRCSFKPIGDNRTQNYTHTHTNRIPVRPPRFHHQASIEVREAGKRAVTHIHPPNHPPQSPTVADGISVSCSALCSSAADPSRSPSMANDDDGTTARVSAATDNAEGPATSGGAKPVLSILHFNDVYNIDSNTAVEPIGGAARFCTAIKSLAHLDPLVLFSGDAFSPSMREYLVYLCL